MNKKDYQKIAASIWRSGCIPDKNKIRQQAKTDMRRLIVNDLIAELKHDNPEFDENDFEKKCGF